MNIKETVDSYEVGSLNRVPMSPETFNEMIKNEVPEIVSIIKKIDDIHIPYSLQYKGTHKTLAELLNSVTSYEYYPMIGHLWTIETSGETDSFDNVIKANDTIEYTGEGWKNLSAMFEKQMKQIKENEKFNSENIKHETIEKTIMYNNETDLPELHAVYVITAKVNGEWQYLGMRKNYFSSTYPPAFMLFQDYDDYRAFHLDSEEEANDLLIRLPEDFWTKRKIDTNDVSIIKVTRLVTKTVAYT